MNVTMGAMIKIVHHQYYSAPIPVSHGRLRNYAELSHDLTSHPLGSQKFQRYI